MKEVYLICYDNGAKHFLHSNGKFYSAFICDKGCRVIVYKRKSIAEKKVAQFKALNPDADIYLYTKILEKKCA